jgi:F0F1-type ATP synthase membrane subunit c/vacuolar-type H+-ATPase subunit K
MRLSVGLALLAGVLIGVVIDAKLQALARDRQITALQVAQCTKADKELHR